MRKCEANLEQLKRKVSSLECRNNRSGALDFIESLKPKREIKLLVDEEPCVHIEVVGDSSVSRKWYHKLIPRLRQRSPTWPRRRSYSQIKPAECLVPLPPNSRRVYASYACVLQAQAEVFDSIVRFSLEFEFLRIATSELTPFVDESTVVLAWIYCERYYYYIQGD